MDIKSEAQKVLKSHKFKGIDFSGGISLAEDNTLDYHVSATARGNIDTPGDSERVLVRVAELFGLGNSQPPSPSPAQSDSSQS